MFPFCFGPLHIIILIKIPSDPFPFLPDISVAHLQIPIAVIAPFHLELRVPVIRVSTKGISIQSKSLQVSHFHAFMFLHKGPEKQQKATKSTFPLD
jgi:hypothetical protein